MFYDAVKNDHGFQFDPFKAIVVRPFFRDHFARLDRQIVLIDVLAALNGGKPAVADLERSMTFEPHVPAE